MNAVSPNAQKDLVWLLQGLAEQVPLTRGSVLLSSDGIVKAAYGINGDDPGRLVAMAAGLFSMARSASMHFDGSDAAGQVIAELEASQLYICWAGFNSVLAVLTQKDADPAVVGYQMAQLIKAVGPFLNTSARTGPST